MARSRRPRAVVDLLLRLRVWTMSSPFSSVLRATWASWTALRLAIFALWRASSSVSVVMEQNSFGLFQNERQSRRDQDGAVGNRRDLHVEATLSITKLPCQLIIGNDAKTDFIGDDNDGTVGAAQGRDKPLLLGDQILSGQQDIADPERQTINQDGLSFTSMCGDRAGQIERCFDRAPPAVASLPMFRNPGRHLSIMGFRCCDVDPRRRAVHHQALGISALSGARAAENKGQTG